MNLSFKISRNPCSDSETVVPASAEAESAGASDGFSAATSVAAGAAEESTPSASITAGLKSREKSSKKAVNFFIVI